MFLDWCFTLHLVGGDLLDILQFIGWFPQCHLLGLGCTVNKQYVIPSVSLFLFLADDDLVLIPVVLAAPGITAAGPGVIRAPTLAPDQGQLTGPRKDLYVCTLTRFVVPSWLLPS